MLSVREVIVFGVVALACVMACGPVCARDLGAPPLVIIHSRDAILSEDGVRDALSIHLAHIDSPYRVTSEARAKWPTDRDERLEEARERVSAERILLGWFGSSRDHAPDFSLLFRVGRQQALSRVSLSSSPLVAREEVGLVVRGALDALARGDLPPGAMILPDRAGARISREVRAGAPSAPARRDLPASLLQFALGYTPSWDRWHIERPRHGLKLGVEYFFQERMSVYFAYSLRNARLATIEDDLVLLSSFPISFGSRTHLGENQWRWGAGMGVALDLIRARRVLGANEISDSHSLAVELQPHIRRRVVANSFIGVDLEVGASISAREPPNLDGFSPRRGRVRPFLSVSGVLFREVEGF